MNITTLPKEVESKIQVRFPDCDPFNHLNNSKYIDYIINAREDQLIKFYDFDIHKKVKESGITWVVAQTQIAYIVPVDIMEIITIQTRLLSYSTKSILLEAILYNENKTQVKAVMWSKQAHYNLRTKRSHEHSSDLLEFFSQIHYPLENNSSFKERVKSLKQLNQYEK
jgi:acyl-CoA thioester hydrolase